MDLNRFVNANIDMSDLTKLNLLERYLLPEAGCKLLKFNPTFIDEIVKNQWKTILKDQLPPDVSFDDQTFTPYSLFGELLRIALRSHHSAKYVRQVWGFDILHLPDIKYLLGAIAVWDPESPIIRALPRKNQELKSELLNKEDYYLMRDLDTEVIMHYLSYELRGDDRPDLVQVFRNLAKKFDGAYNLVFMNGMGDMCVVRDPNGFRPLCYATDGPLFAAASESVALSNVGFTDIKTLQPGEMVLIQDNKLRVERYAESKKTAHCFFEWIYFANVGLIWALLALLGTLGVGNAAWRLAG